MKVQCQSSDRISALPEDAIAIILSHMTMRDALRTSILAKKWRYSWTRMPKLVLDEKMVKRSSNSLDNEIKLLNAIFHVLLRHRGKSISELRISIVSTQIVCEIEPIIYYLSWSKTVKKFVFESVYVDEFYKLPCSFFSLQGLEHLSLKYCEFTLPLMFNGFRTLKSLIFEDIFVTADTLERLLTSCPLLEEFTLIGDNPFLEGHVCTFVELLECLPSIQVLNLSWNYIQQLTADNMPQMFPSTSLVYLRILVLGVCFQQQDELSSTLFVISSSPNLEKIKLQIDWSPENTLVNFFDLVKDFSGLNLDHLKELEMTNFNNHAIEMEFVKLIMAKSPVLKRARIELCRSVSVDKVNKMLRDLVLLPFPRASPAAKLIIQRSKNK